jgi:hypothetical protein
LCFLPQWQTANQASAFLLLLAEASVAFDPHRSRQ